MTDSSGDRNPVELLAEEFVARKRRGEKPTLSEYTDKYPDLAGDIRDLFPALMMMEDLGDSSLASTGPHADGVVALKQLGDYRILREVGRGGMGVVYEAEQQSLGRRVALKVLPPHALNDGQQVRRFEREAKAAARLHHTNIVPVYGVGHHEDTHYYVMQFIPGLGLDGVLEELRLLRGGKVRQPAAAAVPAARSLRQPVKQVAYSLMTGSFHGPEPSSGLGEAAPSTVTGSASDSSLPRLPDGADLSSVSDSDARYWRSVARIGVQVADALEYAHGQGILHRDVKPSNLLMDMNGTVWVTDFGLAKGGDTENLTHTGDIVGTIRYMAPERFQGHSDARSDVYSLGLTLYELIALRPAFDQRDRAKLIQQVLHEEPPHLRKANRAVPRDLETIVQKTMAKEPGRRYARAADLAADLKRFLEDRPIQARRVGTPERFWRWCRRKPALASALGLAAAALLGVTVVSSLFAFTQNRTNGELSKAYSDLTDKQTNLEHEQAQTLREKANTVEALNKYQRLSVLLAAERSRVLAERNDPNHALLWLAQALENAPEDAEELQFPLRANLASLREEHRTAPADPVLEINEKILAQSPDGKTLLTHQPYQNPPRPPRLVDAATGKPFGEPLPFAARFGNVYAAFFPEGKRFVTVWGELSEPGKPRSTIRIWDARTGKPLTAAQEFPDAVSAICMSSNGKRFLTGHGGGIARLWDAGADDLQMTVLDHAVPAKPGTASIRQAFFSPDDTRVLTICDPQGARLWDTSTGKAVGEPMRHGGTYDSVVAAFSPDGKLIVTGGGDQMVRLWNAGTGKPVGAPLAHSYRIRHVGFSPDGQVLLTAAASDDLGADKKFEARLWRAADGEPFGALFHPKAMDELSFSPDGLMVLTVGLNVDTAGNHLAQLWDVETSNPIGAARPVGPERFRHDASRPIAAFSPDGLSLVTQTGTWPLDAALHVPLTLPHPDLVSCVAFSPDGTRLVTGTGRRGVFRQTFAYLWDRATGQPVGQPMPHAGGVQTVAFSPDGNLVLTANMVRPGTGQLWDGHSGKPHGPALDYGYGTIEVGAFSKDGRTVLLGGFIKGNLEPARTWDVATGKRVGAPLVFKDGGVKTLAYSADGLRIVTGGFLPGKTAQLWDARSAQPLGDPMVHNDEVTSVAFNPDGSLVLTASQDRTARLWNGFTGAAVRTFNHDNGVSQALFSPSGKTIFTASMDKTGRLWDAQTGQAIGLPWQHPAPVLCAAFSVDGKVVVTGCADGNARLWAAETGMSIGPPLPHPKPVTAVAFSPDGKNVATVCGDGAARLWDVPPPLPGTVRRLVLWAQVEAGMELDAQGAVHTLDQSALAQRRRELDEAGGPPLVSDNDPERVADRHYRFAQGCVCHGRWWAAAWHLEQILKIRAKDWTAWLLQGQAFYNLGRPDQAAAAYARAFEYGPKEAVLAACNLHIETYLSAELPARGAADKSLVEKRSRAALWYLDQMIANDPANWKLYDRRGWAYADLGQDEQAEDDYRRARALGPDASFFQNPRSPDRMMSSQLTGWGPRHLARKRWQDAAWDYARLIELGARIEDLDICELDASLRLHLGDPTGYRHACQLLVARAGDDAYSNAWAGWICTYGPDATENALTVIAWLENATHNSNGARTFRPALGAAYYRAGRFDEAILCLNERAKENRPQPTVWLFLAMAHRRLGHADEAAKWRAKEAEWFTKESQPAAPGQVDRFNLDSAATLVQALGLHKEWDNFEKLDEDALAELNEAVAKKPEEAEQLLRRGRFHANRGQWDKAAADFDRVVELGPKEARSLLERGRFYVQRGQRDKAAADFTKATALRPGDVELRLECARVRVVARDWQGAADDFRRAVTARPDDVRLRIECGEAEAWAGAWDRAAADFAFAVEKKPEDAQNWSALALAQLGGGDRAAYRARCAAMIDRFGKSPDGAALSQLFMTCAVTPDADADMPAFAELAQRLFRNVSYPPWYQYPLAVVLYRAGKLPEAIAHIDQRVIRLSGKREPQPVECLLLAMAHQRQGNGKEACDYLAKAETWMAAADKQDGDPLGGARIAWSDWRERVIAHTLYQEAETLIKGGKP